MGEREREVDGRGGGMASPFARLAGGGGNEGRWEE